MDPIYPRFAAADSMFYDRPPVDSDNPRPQDQAFQSCPELGWQDWRHFDDGPWSIWVHRDADLAEQGWKIHISAVQANASTALDAAASYCHLTKLPFKYLRTPADLERSLAKDADRGASGKFITIYLPDELALHKCLLALDHAIAGNAGPYILSDLRWNAGPLYVRYGGFRARFTVDHGESVLAITDPRSGALVPDPRDAAFHLPPWVEAPPFIKEQIEALETAPPPAFPTITAALHFSNAGGVYAATIDGEDVVLKEARPHAGWTPDGRDAVTRLVHEELSLRRASSTARVPKVRGVFEAHGHRFLAMERIPGRPLSELVASTNPLTVANASRSQFIAYRDWALGVLATLASEVSALHACGLAHGDLHPGNVLVDPEHGVALIDLEMSVAADGESEAALGARGFVRRGLMNSAQRDLYALACTELHVFLPLTSLIEVDASKAGVLIAEATSLFDLPPSWARRVLSLLGGDALVAERSDGRLPTAEGIAARLRDDATPHRPDRLWPGDPRQFSESPLSLAHGALGAAVVLHRSDTGLTPLSEEWIRVRLRDPSHLDRAGLMDGLAGAVWACRQLELHDEADALTHRLTSGEWSTAGLDLYAGLPGLGLAFVAEAARDPGHLDQAARILSQLHEHWSKTSPPTQVSARRGGLMGGATGTALLALRLYEATGDEKFLQPAYTALSFDVASLVSIEDGSLQVSEGWRTLPYLGYGSAGIGVVLAQYLRYSPEDERLQAAMQGIVTAACTPFTVQSGLLAGRAGLIHFLAMLESTGHSTDTTRASLKHHVAALSLHTLPGERFVGDGLLRASCDLATGSAGTLSALLAARSQDRRHEPWCPIPYLVSPSSPR